MVLQNQHGMAGGSDMKKQYLHVRHAIIRLSDVSISFQKKLVCHAISARWKTTARFQRTSWSTQTYTELSKKDIVKNAIKMSVN